MGERNRARTAPPPYPGAAILAALIAALLVVLWQPAGPRAATLTVPVPTVPAPEPGPVVQAPTARIAWSMAERYALGWQAWQPNAGTYTRDYVHPAAWTVVVDGCDSFGHGQELTRFDVEVRGVGFEYSGARGGDCRQAFTDLPRLGEYDVALTVRNASGHIGRATERIALRDYLIVSLGDSMASGEGSPDTVGSYKLLTKLSSFKDKLRFVRNLALGHSRPGSDPDFKVRERQPVGWRDKRCHRSARAGHALAAEQIERDSPHSSVTFLSLACSGAEIKHLLDTRYSGQQPPTNPQPAELRPQLEVLRELLLPGTSVVAQAAALERHGRARPARRRAAALDRDQRPGIRGHPRGMRQEPDPRRFGGVRHEDRRGQEAQPPSGQL